MIRHQRANRKNNKYYENSYYTSTGAYNARYQ